MATLTKVRTSQGVQVAIFEFTVNDAMANTSEVLTNFKAAGENAYDVIGLPTNAVVVGGDVTVRTVSNDTGAATVSVGDSGSATRYLGATSLKSAARTALVPTAYVNEGALPIRITVNNNTGDATTLSAIVTVLYRIDGRACEVASK